MHQFTARNVILDAHRQSGLVSKYDTPDGNQFSEGLRELQKLIADMNVRDLLPFTQDMGTLPVIQMDSNEFPQVDLQALYEDSFISFETPIEISTIRTANGKTLRKVSRADLFHLAVKEKGIPAFFCYDRVGRLYFDVHPNEPLSILFNRKFEIDKDELDKVLDEIPAEYLQVFVDALAFQLGTANHLPADVLSVLATKMEKSLEKVRKANIKTRHMLLWAKTDVINPSNWRIG